MYDEHDFLRDEQINLEEQTDVNEPSVTDSHSMFEGFYRKEKNVPYWDERI
jgi:hypothetical protein